MLKAFSGKKKQRQRRSRGGALCYSPSCSDWGASSPPAGGERARGPGLLPWLPSPPARLKLHPAGTWPPLSHPLPPSPPPPPISTWPPQLLLSSLRRGEALSLLLAASLLHFSSFFVCFSLGSFLHCVRAFCWACVCVHVCLSSPLSLHLVRRPADHCSLRFCH